jgi:hypothetical protein
MKTDIYCMSLNIDWNKIVFDINMHITLDAKIVIFNSLLMLIKMSLG